jgi:glycosyltransferase involved in cell wall biosynthesis
MGSVSLRYLFDLTTTAQWQGPVVGIVRVEQELAKRARHYLREDVAFCLYDRSRAALCVIDDALADDIIAGRLRVDLSAPRPNPRTGIRSSLRAALLRNTAVYQLFQRLRGRSLTREQILQIQSRELPQQSPPREKNASLRQKDEIELIPFKKLPHHPAFLDDNTQIISGGLDWQHKNLRALWTLKQSHRFSYCAIVYDLIPLRFPQFVVPGYVELLTDYFGELLWLADRAICISESTRQDWQRFAQEVGAEPVPADIFPLGCDLAPPSTDKLATALPTMLQGKRFVLYVSTIEPRKNHRMLYEAWDECMRTKRLDATRDRLVFVGRRGWATDDLLREIETNPLTRDTIVLLHDVSDAQLTTLYQSCAFVVFPSLHEGFGLPLAEALRYGKLCISSNSGALAEIGGNLVIRLDPKDTLAWAGTIARLMASQSEIDEREVRVRSSYRHVTWDDAASIFFNGVIGRHNGAVKNWTDQSKIDKTAPAERVK